jgi:F-type H+-transporting ATPase subunit b
MMALAESSIQLVPDGTLLLHLALVVVMVTVLNLTLLKPINKVLEERERRTKGRLGDAQGILASAKEKVRLWEQGLRQARNDGYRLLEKERSDALRERELRLLGLKQELAKLVAEQKAEIQRQEQEARRVLQAEAQRLAALIGSQILGRTISG